MDKETQAVSENNKASQENLEVGGQMNTAENEQGTKQLTLSKSEWLAIGRKTGWLKSLAATQQQIQQLRDVILNYDHGVVLEAIRGVGEEVVAGFAPVKVEEVPEVIEMCRYYDLVDIQRACERRLKGGDAEDDNTASEQPPQPEAVPQVESLADLGWTLSKRADVAEGLQ